MHELSLATSLLEIIREELAKHGATKLTLVRVRFGPLSNVVPEALEMAFASLTEGTEYEGARLEMLQEPLVLTCGECQKDFEAADPVPYADCPRCGCNFLHTIKSGKELYLDHLEAD